MRPWSRPRRLSLSPASLAFGSVAVNTTSAKSVSIINSSRTSVTISQANVTGAAYSVTGLTLPFTLAARSSTSFTVIFAPLTANSFSGNVSLVSTAFGSPNNLPLTGTGAAAPLAQLTANPASWNFNNVRVGSNSTQARAASNTENVTKTVSQITTSAAGISPHGFSAPLTLPPCLTPH